MNLRIVASQSACMILIGKRKQFFASILNSDIQKLIPLASMTKINKIYAKSIFLKKISVTINIRKKIKHLSNTKSISLKATTS